MEHADQPVRNAVQQRGASNVGQAWLPTISTAAALGDVSWANAQVRVGWFARADRSCLPWVTAPVFREVGVREKWPRSGPCGERIGVLGDRESLCRVAGGWGC